MTDYTRVMEAYVGTADVYIKSLEAEVKRLRTLAHGANSDWYDAVVSLDTEVGRIESTGPGLREEFEANEREIDGQ